MKVLEILKNGEFLFAEDNIESKKVKEEVNNVNTSFTDMKEEIKNFNDFKKSQLEGSYNSKIAKAKSLKEVYQDWKSFNLAFDRLAQEENAEIAKYDSIKAKLINSLKSLLEVTQKESAVSLYDLFENEYKKCQEGHEVVILGDRNTEIITKAIEEFENDLTVTGNYAKVEPQELNPDYKLLNQNASNCRDKAYLLYQDKQNKLAKVETSVVAMEEIGNKVVFFETYKNIFIDMGISEKDIAKYEKSFLKQYGKIKKALQKELKIEFADICNIKIEEPQSEEKETQNQNTAEEKTETQQPSEPVEPKEEAPVEKSENADTANDATALPEDIQPKEPKPRARSRKIK